MKYLYYNTLKECQDRIDKCDIDLNLLGIEEKMKQYNSTITYAIPEKHPTKEIYSLCIDESFVHLFTENELETAQEKDDSWKIKIEF